MVVVVLVRSGSGLAVAWGGYCAGSGGGSGMFGPRLRMGWEWFGVGFRMASDGVGWFGAMIWCQCGVTRGGSGWLGHNG